MKLPRNLTQLQALNDEIIQSLRDAFVPCLKKHLDHVGGLEFVILYGSRARGDYGYASDVDLIVCSNGFEKIRVVDRPDLVSSCIDNVHVEPVCYTVEDARMALEQGKLTMLDALEEGLTLFSQGRILERLKQVFEVLKKTNVIQRVDPSMKGVHWNVADIMPFEL